MNQDNFLVIWLDEGDQEQFKIAKGTVERDLYMQVLADDGYSPVWRNTTEEAAAAKNDVFLVKDGVVIMESQSIKNSYISNKIVVCDSCHADFPQSLTKLVEEQAEIFCISCYEDWENNRNLDTEDEDEEFDEDEDHLYDTDQMVLKCLQCNHEFNSRSNLWDEYVLTCANPECGNAETGANNRNIHSFEVIEHLN